MAKKEKAATKPHWTTKRDHFESVARSWKSIGGTVIEAAGWEQAVRTALRQGFAWPASEVPTPCLDRLRLLESEGDKLEIARFRRANALEIQYEQRAKVFAENWQRTEGQRAEAQAKAHEERKAAQREERVQAKLADLAREDAVAREAELRERAERAVS